MIIFVILIIITAYAVFQTIYTSYFMYKSQDLVKKVYVGQKSLGDAKNPEFDLFVDGDSVGAGVGASSFETSVAGRVAEFYAQKYHVNFINNSVSGSRMSSLINKDIPTQKQNLTLLVVSSNDLFHFSDFDQFKLATEKVLAKYSKNTDKLILIGPGRVFDTGALPFFIKPLYRAQGPKYAAIISKVEKKYPNVVYVNPQNVSVPRSKYGATDASDGFHPNDEGHMFWFDLIKPSL